MRDGDVFMGESSTILSGARRLTDWVRSDRVWVATPQTQQSPVRPGLCQPAYPRCSYAEELFINGERLQRVGSLDEVGPPAWGPSPGQWFFDYAADAIYISYDPTWLTVETSVTSIGFAPTADNVTITGLTVFGMGDDLLIEGNAICRNNTSHYFQRWEGGGAKFVISRNLVVRNNFVHFNDGPGIWSDIDCIDVLIENNTSQDNALSGIFHEIGYRAIIRNNVVSRNGWGYPTGLRDQASW